MLYRHLIRPWLFRVDPEEAHTKVMRRLSRWRLGARFCESLLRVDDPRLGVAALGLDFRNPVGLAAGLDKHGEASAAWQSLGFGFFELGTVTPRPQAGNAPPRLFRLPRDRALINRLGLNSVGADRVAENLGRAPRPSVPVGINVGKNSDTPNEGAVADYLAVIERLRDHADYFAINVSSPNMKGLRDLQHPSKIRRLVEEAAGAARRADEGGNSRPVPVLVKVAPDFEGRGIEETVDAALAGGAAGIIATNTTVSREGLTRAEAVREAGGLSGAPLRARADGVVRRIHRLTRGRTPIIGVGGIFDARDAFERICAGATLVQVYTGLVYEGPGMVRRINRGLLRLMRRHGLSGIADAVGRDSA
jgi:dihydroorotate dehydrogenase